MTDKFYQNIGSFFQVGYSHIFSQNKRKESFNIDLLRFCASKVKKETFL